jgi:hypothetical protein
MHNAIENEEDKLLQHRHLSISLQLPQSRRQLYVLSEEFFLRSGIIYLLGTRLLLKGPVTVNIKSSRSKIDRNRPVARALTSFSALSRTASSAFSI